MKRRFSAMHVALAALIGVAVGTMGERQPAATGAQQVQQLQPLKASGIEINRGSGPALDLAEGDQLRAESAPREIPG